MKKCKCCGNEISINKTYCSGLCANTIRRASIKEGRAMKQLEHDIEKTLVSNNMSQTDIEMIEEFIAKMSTTNKECK